MAGVRTSIIGRPRPLPPHRRASHPVQSHHLATTPSIAKSPYHFCSNDCCTAFQQEPQSYVPGQSM